MAEIGEVHKREKGVFEWTVRDFMSLPEQVGDGYFSPFFSFGGAWWCFQMYPNGQRNNSDGYICVYLTRISPGPPIELDYSLGLKATDNEIAGEIHGVPKFEKTFDGYGIRFRRSLLLERQPEIAPSGHLIIVCRMKSDPSTKTTSNFFSYTFNQ